VHLHRIATLGLSAASGLVRRGDELLVVADDELVLHRYTLDGTARGELPLFPGELPIEPRARKEAKPDLEALVELPGERLLALGSCSKPWRERGALVEGDRVREVTLSPLCDALRDRFDRINFEGAAVLAPHLVLLSRRTGRRGRNALVRLDLSRSLATLSSTTPSLEADALVDVIAVELGDEGGIAYGFTDASAWRGGLLFAAAAENTDDPVEDGACEGCVIGELASDGRVLRRWPVAPCTKLEGIAVDDTGELYAVADADDRNVLAPLFRGRVPAP
jgi:hypothetical protein